MVNSQMPVDGSQEHCLQDIFPTLMKQDFGALITSPLHSMTYQLKFAHHQDICHRAGGIVPSPQGNTDAACCVGRGLTSWWHGDGGEEEWPTGEAIGRDPEITVVLWDNSAGYSSIMLAECRWNQNHGQSRWKPFRVSLCWPAGPDCLLLLLNASKNEAPDFSSKNRDDK